MIKSPSSKEDNILLFTENKNEKMKIKPKLYDKKNTLNKNKPKKEEEKESYSHKNKLKSNKKNISKIKENQIKTIKSNEIISKNQTEFIKYQKNSNKANKKVVQLKIYNPNQTLDNFCFTDRLSKKSEENQYMTTVSTPKKSYKNSFKNILKQSNFNKINTQKNTIFLFKDYNKNSNRGNYYRNKRLKTYDLRKYYTEKNADLYLTTDIYDNNYIRKYSGQPNFIIKEIDEPSYITENCLNETFDHGIKSERYNRSFNDSLFKEMYEKVMKNQKEFNSSQKNLYFLRKRNKYLISNIKLNGYNSLSKTKINKNNNTNLNRTFYRSKSNLKGANINLNSTFCEIPNIKSNIKKKYLFNDSKTKNKSLAPILENEKYHYLQGTICTKNKIVKRSKENFFAEYPTLRKIKTLIDKNEIKGKEKYKVTEKSKKIINQYNISPTKKSETKVKMNNITIKKNNYNNNNILVNKNRNKSKKYAIKNRAISMDNSISNITTLSNKQLFNGKLEDYLITKELGKGSYAVVKLAKHRVTKEKFAIKIYTKESLLDPQKRNTVKNEINILKQLNHINIMKLYEVIDSSKYLYLVLEYIKGISLLDVIKEEKFHFIEQRRAIKLFLQIVKGISYCQSKNINHRDIKLENILVIKNDIIKIIDFGFAVKGNRDTYQKLFCGTPSYMPPEIVNKEKYIAQCSDVWSLGVLLYAMLYGRFPFQGKDDKKLFELINKGEVKFPEDIIVSENIKNLLKKILNVNPKLRPSPEEIINEILFGE
jgi:hypothetical protein